MLDLWSSWEEGVSLLGQSHKIAAPPAASGPDPKAKSTRDLASSPGPCCEAPSAFPGRPLCLPGRGEEAGGGAGVEEAGVQSPVLTPLSLTGAHFP